MSTIKQIFAWWTGNTIGTRFFTWRHGEAVGTDSFGNTYYRQRRGVGPLGVPRRWVTYVDASDPTTVPPEWHGWLHYTTDELPSDQSYLRRSWEKPHQPNMTGTPDAYRPRGSLLNTGISGDDEGNADYVPWSPGGST
ncbi:MAG: NADH:ubiquinone oxidoreductase subunit NDUFA12 [Pseudomonadota bacterium]